MTTATHYPPITPCADADAVHARLLDSIDGVHPPRRTPIAPPVALGRTGGHDCLDRPCLCGLVAR